MFIANSFDSAKKETGVWTDFEGARLKIASQRNDAYTRTLKRLSRPYERQMQKGKLDPQTSVALLCEAMATDILVDWEGVGELDAKGNAVEVEYSVEKAKEFLIDNPELREFVASFSEDLENFKKEDVAATAKKSGKES